MTVDRNCVRVGPGSRIAMTPRPFGSLPSGQPVEAYTLANASGASIQVVTYGGIVTSLRMPDRQSRLADIVLGFNDLGSYLRGHPYFGAITGRIAGRVSGGQLAVGGRTYPLERNDGPNHLHGGRCGLDKRLWAAQPQAREDGAPSLRLTYHSPDGEEGYPGNVDIAVTYTLTETNAFVIETEATADRVTPLSLTNHSYFNLGGEDSGEISGHELQIFAEEFVPTDDSMTLSDRREQVSGRGADFRSPRRLGEALPTLFKAHGDVYLLRAPRAAPPQSPTLAARVAESRSGRVLEVFTDESCLQFYTGVSLNGTLVGKSGFCYGPHAGFCLECQGYPNASRLGGFGDILVRPGRPQLRRTVYAFSTS
jgi:aldose 1-epimerase